MQPVKPEDLSKALQEAERSAIDYEKYAHLDDAEREVLEQKDEERRKKVKDRGDVQQILKIVEVRRTLYRILEFCGPYQQSFDPTSARISDFNEGRRSAGLELLKMILDADNGAYLQMINEHQSDAKTEQERKRKEQEKHAN
jgi:hypothetical protein